MIALTVCYKPEISFDADYYHAKHIPLVAEKLGPHGLKSTEVRKIVGTPMGTPALERCRRRLNLPTAKLSFATFRTSMAACRI